MIKALLRNKTLGEEIAVLGLSGENVTRLMAGEPITLDLADLGLASQRLVILGGRTEADIEHELRARFPGGSA